METKPLLFGLIGFFIGGLLVSVSATLMKPEASPAEPQASMASSMHMATASLADKSGDEFDKAFIAEMIIHHQGAIDMARLAESRAKHEEIKQLSKDIIAAQEVEIQQMNTWRSKWGYETPAVDHGTMQH